MKQANVSISLHGATAVATDVAQVILMDGSLSHLTTLFDISNRLDANLRRGLLITLIPVVINIGGAFLFHFGIIQTLITNNLSLGIGIANAASPLMQFERNKENT